MPRWIVDRKFRDQFWSGGLILLSALVVWSALTTDATWLFSSNPVAMSRALVPGHDKIDVPIILNSIASKPTFWSTFSWWHESWTKEVPFWRPLSIQCFWLEKRFFTLDRYNLWIRVSVVLHLACIAAFGRFIYLLTSRRDVTLLAAAIYAVARPALWTWINQDSTNIPAAIALTEWKNQPDLWTDFFTFAALALTIERRYWAAIFCCAVAVCFKESGWMAFLLSAGTAAFRGDLRKIPVPTVAGGIIIVLALVLLRLSAGSAVLRGYHMGTNDFWLERYTGAVGGYVLNYGRLYPPAAAIGVGLFFIGLVRKRLTIIGLALIVAATFLIAVLLQQDRLQTSLTIAISSFLDPVLGGLLLKTGVIIALWLYGAYALLSNPQIRPLGIYAVACSFVTALSYVAATQVLAHALHLTYGFESLLDALAIVALCQRVAPKQTTVSGMIDPGEPNLELSAAR